MNVSQEHAKGQVKARCVCLHPAADHVPACRRCLCGDYLAEPRRPTLQQAVESRAVAMRASAMRRR